MRVIIIGPIESGKTTLLHKLIDTNRDIKFTLVIDNYEQFSINVPPAHCFDNYIITARTLDSIPEYLKRDALILNMEIIRHTV